VTERTVGDQPGRGQKRYVREWRRLPDGVLFAPWSYLTAPQPSLGLEDRYFPFVYRTDLPFPDTETYAPVGAGPPLPCVVFGPTGQLLDLQDRVLTLVPGSVLVGRDANGAPTTVDLPQPRRDLKRTYEETRILVNGMTGRVAIDVPPML
jgi:hypothetical protein